jgi:hypothetical protein
VCAGLEIVPAGLQRNIWLLTSQNLRLRQWNRNKESLRYGRWLAYFEAGSAVDYQGHPVGTGKTRKWLAQRGGERRNLKKRLVKVETKSGIKVHNIFIVSPAPAFPHKPKVQHFRLC